MIIIKDPIFVKQLLSILRYIANDKISASIKFEKELNQLIKDLINFPYKFRPSYYFEDESYRDLIYKGYTIIYKVEKKRILILEIFKWEDR